MTTSGPNSAGTGANDASVGTKAWTTTSSITTSNNSYATIGSSMTTNQTTQYLKCTNFSFAVPVGATVNGITVEAELAEQDSYGGTRDLAVRIVKGGTIGSTDKSRVLVDWPSPDINTYVVYGSSSDLWGETWTYSDINDSTFGFAIRAQYSGAKTSKPRVDHVRITVTYTAGGVTSNASSTIMW